MRRLLRTRAVVEWNAVTEWTGYPPRDAREIATALGRLQRRRIDAGDDHRTPWEVNAPPQAIVDFEMYQMHRSVDNLRAMGWM